MGNDLLNVILSSIFIFENSVKLAKCVKYVVLVCQITTGILALDRRIHRPLIPMGLFSHLVTMCVGAYGGAFLAQNYEIGKVPSILELVQQLERYVQNYKKER